MSKINSRLAAAFFVGSCAVSAEVVIGQSWLAQHAWIEWPLWALFLLFLFMALRSWDVFQRYYWKVASLLVSPLEGPVSEARTPGPSGDLSPERLLKEKVLNLSSDLFAFLREKGPEPKPMIDKSMTDVEVIQAGLEARSPYVEAIHYGYQRRFRQRAADLFNELAEHGIQDWGIEQWEIDPPQIQNAERVKKIAERLVLIAARMDIAEQEKGI